MEEKWIEFKEWLLKHPFICLAGVGLFISYLSLTVAVFVHVRLLPAGIFFGAITALFAGALFLLKSNGESK